MAFCQKCGNELPNGAKFCANCGTPAGASGSENVRKQEFVGTMKKCPNCGQILQAFQAKCPSCGHEIIGASTTTSVREFFDKCLQAPNNEQKLELINSYPIPNAKEDLLEFALLASQQIKTSYIARIAKTNMYTAGTALNSYGNTSLGSLKDRLKGNITKVGTAEIVSAWESKLEQVIHKAKISFSDDINTINQFIEIASDVNTIKQKFEQKESTAKKRQITVTLIIFLFIFLLFGISMITLRTVVLSIDSPEDKEEKRLELLMKEIQTDIKTGNYDAAELKLPGLRWNYNESSKYQKVNIEEWEKKKSILEKNLDAARGDK